MFFEKVMGKNRTTDLHFNNRENYCFSYVFGLLESDFPYLCIECIIFPWGYFGGREYG